MDVARGTYSSVHALVSAGLAPSGSESLRLTLNSAPVQWALSFDGYFKVVESTKTEATPLEA